MKQTFELRPRPLGCGADSAERPRGFGANALVLVGEQGNDAVHRRFRCWTESFKKAEHVPNLVHLRAVSPLPVGFLEMRQEMGNGAASIRPDFCERIYYRGLPNQREVRN